MKKSRKFWLVVVGLVIMAAGIWLSDHWGPNKRGPEPANREAAPIEEGAAARALDEIGRLSAPETIEASAEIARLIRSVQSTETAESQPAIAALVEVVERSRRNLDNIYSEAAVLTRYIEGSGSDAELGRRLKALVRQANQENCANE